MASYGATETDLSTERTPGLSLRARSAVFHAATSRRLTPGCVEKKKEERQQQPRPQSACVRPGSQLSSQHISQSQSRLQPRIKAQPYSKASSPVLQDPKTKLQSQPYSKRSSESSAPAAQDLIPQALSQLQPHVSACASVNHLASGKAPPIRACLYVPLAKVSTPASIPRANSQQTWSTGARPSCGTANYPLDGTYGGNYDHCLSGFTKNSKFNCNFSSTQSELTSQKSPSLKIRSLRVGQPGGGGLLGKRSLPHQAGISPAGAVLTVNSHPTCPSPPKTPTPALSPSETPPSSGGTMPTNQSSPWGSGKLRASSKADSPTTTSITTPTRPTAATKVPSSPQEPARSKDLAKPFSSLLKQKAAAPSVAQVTESGDGNDTDTTQSRLTAVPRSVSKQQDGTQTQRQQLGGTQTPNQAVAGLEQTVWLIENGGGKAVMKEKGQPMVDCLSPNTPPSIPTEDPEKERNVGSDVQLREAARKLTGGSPSLRTSHNGAVIDRPQGAGVGGVLLLGLEPPASGCPPDQITTGRAALQQTAKSTASIGVSLTVSHSGRGAEDQGASVGEEAVEASDASSLDNTRRDITTAEAEMRTKTRRNLQTATRESDKSATSEKSPTRGTGAAVKSRSSTTDSQSTSVSTVNQPVRSSLSAAVSQSPPRDSQSTSRRTSPPTASPTATPPPGAAMPAMPSASVSATQEKQPTKTYAVQDVTSGPAGASVCSVTNQISAIHLTKQEQLASSSSSSSSPSSSSPSLSKEHLVVESQLSCQESVAMQVDGDEEDFPDELENACSDDDASDCSSINGASSTTSITLLSGVEEPMSSEVEDDREERPALVTSLFPLFPPTLYFSTANERVELLPPEQRRLLKWKMSSVTPNVVRHTIARSHFKATKRSHDWLGCWGHHMKSPGFKAIREYQKLNHFPGSFQIGRKDRLWRNLSKMQARFGKREFSFFPRSFILPQDMKLLRKAWEDSGSRQKWIIKPPASARGIGIQVIHKWSQMPRKRPLLVQKYLHKPYLISGNKFDLRIYVYVTSYNPLRVYMFSDGLVRFASCKYSSSIKSLSNKFMHLTNYSVNKKNSEYQSNSDDKACQGHKWALKALWQYLGAKGVNTTLIWEKIKDIVIKTIIASDPYVNSRLKTHLRSAYSCHELFGFDIMLDENLKPWVLEVNISPSLHSNTALDVSIKGQMIRDLLNLAGFLLPQRDDVVAASCSSTTSSTSSLCGGNREKTRPDLSTDEKVKRAFYLTQRFTDQDFLPTVLDVLTPEDVRVLAESEDELSRRGQFERVFPSSSSSQYLRFFECPRYLNILLDQWEQKHWNNRTKGISLLRTLCQRGVHLGTSDPAHMWSKCSYISRFEPHRQDDLSPSSVVVSHRRQSHPEDEDGSDREVQSLSSSMPNISLPASPSPGSSATTSPCPSPHASLTQSLLPGQFV